MSDLQGLILVAMFAFELTKERLSGLNCDYL